MGLPKRLTEMQQRFAEFLVFGGPEGPMTQTEAALAAGYTVLNVQDKKDQNYVIQDYHHLLLNILVN